MYSFLSEDFLDALLLFSDFASDLVVDFDVGGGVEVDDRAEGVGIS